MRVLAPSVFVLGACSFSGLPSGNPDVADAPPGEVPDGPPPGEPDATPTTPPPDAMAPLDCPSNYDQEYQGHFYRFSNTKRTWADAEADCESDGDDDTHLIALDTDGEWSTLVGAAFLMHGGEWQHIGVLRDLTTPDGPWRTVTGGAAPVLKWRATILPPSIEPNNGGGDSGEPEPVVALDPNPDLNHLPTAGGFLDVAVGFQAYYVCECDGRPAVDADYD
jgi:hypothetical protein